MHNYKFTIQYNGTKYSGWQIQPNVPTIQGEITKVLEIITNRKVNLIGSGRTDSGVHAIGQVANFKSEKILETEKVEHSINSMLPEDISISGFREADLDFHSRFDAKMRSYLYVFNKFKSPFFSQFGYTFSPVFDYNLETLNSISDKILGQHNFEAFSKKNSDTENMVCNITLAKWRRKKEHLFFRVDGDRFLHGMVRTMVGTILSIAKEGKGEEEIYKILDNRERKNAGKSFPAKGLFLLKVKY